MCGYGMLPVDKQACEMILRDSNKEAKVEIVSGSRGKRIADDFLNAGFNDVSFDPVGYFEEWVKRKCSATKKNEEQDHIGLKHGG